LISLSSATRIDSLPSVPAPLDAASLGSRAVGSKAPCVEKRAASEVARTGLIR
jgi:hypothetical protein